MQAPPLNPVPETRLWAAPSRLGGGGEPKVRLAHEALVTRWPRLRRITEELAEAIRVRDDVERRAETWAESDRDPSELLHSVARLANAEDFLRQGLLPARPGVAEFVAASRRAAEHEAVRREEMAAASVARARLEAENAEIARQAAEAENRANALKLENSENERRALEAETRRAREASEAELRQAELRAESERRAAEDERLRAEQSAQAERAESELRLENAEIARAAAVRQARTAQRFQRSLAAGLVLVVAAGGAAAVGWHSANVTADLLATESGERQKQLALAESNLTRFIASLALRVAKSDPDFGRLALLDRLPDDMKYGPSEPAELQDAASVLTDIKQGDPARARLPWGGEGPAAFSRDGRRVATFSDKTVYVWDMANGALVTAYPFLDERIKTVSWSPQSDRLAVQFNDTAVALVHLENGRVERFVGTSGSVLGDPAASVDPWNGDGRKLVLPDLTGQLTLWDADMPGSSSQLGPRLEGASAFWSSDRKRIAILSPGSVWVLDMSNGEALSRTAAEEGEKFANVAIGPDGATFATSSSDGTVKVWRSGFGKPLTVIEDYRRGSGYNTVKLVWGGAGNRLVTWVPGGSGPIIAGGESDALRVWDFDGTKASPLDTRFVVDPDDPVVSVVVAGRNTVVVETGNYLINGDLTAGRPIGALEKAQFGKGIRISASPAYEEDRMLMAVTPDAGATTFSWLGELLASPLERERLTPFRTLTEEERTKFGLAIASAAPLPEAPGSCDALAAHPLDPGKPVGIVGVQFGNIDVEAALAACTREADAEPANLRLRYELGRTFERKEQFTEAIAAYRKAAEGGYGMASYALGLAARDGVGVPKDNAEAVRLMRIAVDAGTASAAGPLGRLLWDASDGIGPRAEAIAVWQRGMDLGDPNSHTQMAWVAELGRDGSPANPEYALLHYAVATRMFERAGETEAAAWPRLRRAGLARSLDPRRVADIWKQVKSWPEAKRPAV